MNEFAQKNEKVNKQENKSSVIDACFDWISAAVIALVLISILFSTLARTINVSGDSMTNTLLSGEKLLLTGLLTDPEYGDIVVIRRDNDTPLIKRVIGLPGDKIFIDDSHGKVYRNGVELDEPYVRGGFTPSKGLNTAYEVPEDGIFVMGDNRKDSLDSRQLKDQIKMKDMVGVVTFRLSPFESLRNGD